MRDYLNIGSSPVEEDCVQLGSPNDRERSIKECHRFIDLIRKKFGNEPNGALLYVKGFEHDFGRYYEVVCYYDDTIQESVDYAFKCDSDAPSKWE